MRILKVAKPEVRLIVNLKIVLKAQETSLVILHM